MTSTKFDGPYDQITAIILAELEKGVAPWVKPWATKGDQMGQLTGFPMNFSTGKDYRGINVILGMVACYSNGFDIPAFATFKQIAAMKGTVKKGSKSTRIYYMNKTEFEPTAADANKKLNENGKIEGFILRGYNVFNIAQCEGIEIDFPALRVPSTMPADTAELIAALKAKVLHGGNEASFNFAFDRIDMPVPEVFETVDHYKSVLFHEITHWTGHKSRLDRLKNVGVKTGYAAEELVAELGAAFLCAEFGVATKLRHAEYIGSWIKHLKDDKKAFYRAASDAQKALDFIRQTVTNSDTSAEEEDQREAA